MTPEQIGLLSGLLTIVSAIPYMIRTYQRKIEPYPTSWSLWTAIGLVILLTFRSSGAEANIWPAVFGFTNPLIIVTLTIVQRDEKWTKLKKIDIACIVICAISLILWTFVHNNRELSQWALYLAIVSDACAGVPTMNFVIHNPHADRPFAWGFFGVAYGLSMFAITEHTFANYALPAYMVIGSTIVTTPLVMYRIRNRVPLGEWI